MPPRIYAKHKSTTRIRVHDKAWYTIYANTGYTHTKLSQDIIKYYTVHVYYIITKSKMKYIQYVYKKLTSRKEIP